LQDEKLQTPGLNIQIPNAHNKAVNARKDVQNTNYIILENGTVTTLLKTQVKE
jgi:hypothetical protein